MIRNRRPASAAAALALFAAVGVCGVVAARVVRAVWATRVQQTPAHTASANADVAAPANFTTKVTSSIYSLQVEVDPARTGTNSIHLYAYTPDNKPLRVVEWKGTAGLPDKGIEPVAIPLLQFTDNHAIGQVSLPAPGGWQLRFTVRISDIDQATVSVTVPVR
jgi:copper transport protein